MAVDDRVGRGAADGGPLVDRSSAVAMTAAMVVANLANYGFQILLGRALSVEEYGLLAGFMTVVTVITVAGTSLQATAARAVATGEHRVGGPVVDGLTRSALLVAGVLVVMGLAVSPIASRFFNIGLLPLLLLACFVVPAALDSIALGRLQGLQRFTDLAVYSTCQALAKLAVAAVVLALGFAATGLVGGIVAASLVVAVVGLRRSRDAGSIEVLAVAPDVRRALGAYTMLWFMLGADVLFARAFFAERDAGIYAAAAVLGKAVLWIPVMVGQVIFPRLAARSTRGDSVEAIARRAVAVVAVVVSVSVVALYLLGDTVFRLLYGERFAEAGDTAWKIGLAVAPFALVVLLIQHFLARREGRFLVWMAVVLVAESLALYLGPQQPDWYVLVLFVSGALVLAVTVPPYAWSRVAGLAGQRFRK